MAAEFDAIRATHPNARRGKHDDIGVHTAHLDGDTLNSTPFNLVVLGEGRKLPPPSPYTVITKGPFTVIVRRESLLT